MFEAQALSLVHDAKDLERFARATFWGAPEQGVFRRGRVPQLHAHVIAARGQDVLRMRREDHLPYSIPVHATQVPSASITLLAL